MSNKLAGKMNICLAKQDVNNVKIRSLHWYVKGKGFFALHLKLDELYNKSADIVDEVAERLLALGKKPISSMQSGLTVVTMKERQYKPITCEEAVKVLASDVKQWIKDSEEIVRITQEAKDGPSIDQLNGYLSEYQKRMWMLEPYLA